MRVALRKKAKAILTGRNFGRTRGWPRRKEMKKKHEALRDRIAKEAFNAIVDKDRSWLEKRQFTKSIRPARVEIYRSGI